jgi:hypothetical protein
VNEIKIIMLSLTSTLLLADDNVDDVDDVNNADDERKRRKSSIEKEKESRLDTNLDRVERLVKCCFFASLTVS